MTALTDIGELSISDSREGGKDYLLRPSFEAMTRIGTPEEIVQAYATIHGNDVAQLIDVCAGTLGRFPAWLSPSFNRAAEKLLSTCMLVLQPVHVGLIIGGRALHSRGDNGHVRFDAIRTIQKLFTRVEFYTYAGNRDSARSGDAEGPGDS